MLEALRHEFLPNKVVLLRPDGEEGKQIARLAAYTRDQTSIDGKATAYVCRDYACALPTTKIDAMLASLEINRL